MRITKLNLNRTIQATSVLLSRSANRRMSYTRLLKLLYLADRSMLEETGSPITFDRIVAMKHGPVLSETYDLIKGEHIQAEVWNHYFSREQYQLVPTTAEPGRANLSRRAVAILNKVSDEYSGLDTWDLVDHLHAVLPEWGENWPGSEANNTSIPVAFEDVLRALEFEDEDVTAIANEIRATRGDPVG